MSRKKLVYIEKTETGLAKFVVAKRLTRNLVLEFHAQDNTSQALVIAELEGRHDDRGPLPTIAFLVFVLPLAVGLIGLDGFEHLPPLYLRAFGGILLIAAYLFIQSVISQAASRSAASRLAAYRHSSS